MKREATWVPVSALAGRVVTRWQGTEMALVEGEAVEDVLWEDPGIPFLQLINLDLQLANGQVFRLLSHLEDGTGFHGLYLMELDAMPVLERHEDAPFLFRDRQFPEWPAGEIEITELRHDGPNATAEVRLLLPGNELRLVAGEVHEQFDGSLRIIECDESILVQLNGMRP
jgi:hypothetical protein